MESFMKTASRNNNSLATCFYIKAALFHSTPVLDRKRRTNWDSSGGSSRNSSKRNYNYSRRCRKRHSKHTLLRNVSEFAEHLFQSWQDDRFFREPASSKGSRWFREQDWVKGKKTTNFGSQGSHWGSYRNGGTFHFCDEDDEDVEVIFRSAFGGDRCSYWSFVNDDSFRWKSSSSTGKHSRNWRSRYEDDYDTYEEYDDDDDSESNLASDRLALGLSASGPLKLEEVKNAYRACALKYHPDRHQGSSKAVAEEKFKLCSAAYQSLCDKMD